MLSQNFMKLPPPPTTTRLEGHIFQCHYLSHVPVIPLLSYQWEHRATSWPSLIGDVDV